MTNTQTPHTPDGAQRQLAHDLRNSLSAIYSNAQFLEMSLSRLKLDDEVGIANSITDEVRKMMLIISDRMDAPQ